MGKKPKAKSSPKKQPTGEKTTQQSSEELEVPLPVAPTTEIEPQIQEDTDTMQPQRMSNQMGAAAPQRVSQRRSASQQPREDGGQPKKKAKGAGKKG